MRKIDHFNLAKEAAVLSWKNPAFWILGFLVSLPGIISETADRIGITGSDGDQERWVSYLKGLETGTAAMIIFGICAVAIVLVALSVLSQAGLIVSISKETGKGLAGLKDSFSSGKRFFWKIVCLDAIIVFSVTAFASVLALPIAAISGNGNPAALAAIAIPAIVMMIGAAILSMLIMNLGQIYVVLGRLGTIDAIEKAYALIRTEWKEMLRMLAILLFLALAAYLSFFAAAAISAISTGWIAKSGTSRLVANITLTMILISFVKSIYAVMIQAIWVLFFRKIASRKETLLGEKIATETEPSVSAPSREGTAASQRNE